MDQLKNKFNRILDEGKPNNNQSVPQQESFGSKFTGKILSRATNLFKGEFDEHGPVQGRPQQPQIDLKDISDTLIKQNLELKTLVEKQQSQISDLKDQLDTLTDLEQHANNENECLKFELLSIKHGDQDEKIGQTDLKESKEKIVEQLRELKAQKREQDKLVQDLKNEIEGYKALFEDKENEQGSDPGELLQQLNFLYQQNKLSMGQNENSNVLIGVLMRDYRVYKHYREKLYQMIAKQAIETSEFLYKSSSGRNQGSGIKNESRIFKENKKLKEETKQLKEQLETLQSQNQHLTNFISQKETLFKKKQEVMLLKFKKLLNQITNIKGQYFQIKNDQEELIDFNQSYIAPNLEHLKKRAQHFSTKNDKDLQEARKAVFEKNKQISELSLKNQQIQKQLTDGQQNNQLIYQKNKEIGDLFNKQNQLKQELEEYKEAAENYEEQCKMLKQRLFDLDQKPKVVHNSQNEEKLKQEIEKLKKEIAEMKHVEVVKSLMKGTDEHSKEIEAAKKAVIEKNKVISDMFNKQHQMLLELEEKDKEIMQLKSQSNNSQQRQSQSNIFGYQSEQPKSNNQPEQQQDLLGSMFKSFWGSAFQLQSKIQESISTSIPPQSQTQPHIQTPQQHQSSHEATFHHFLELPHNEKEVEEKIKEVEQEYNTDSPSRIFHLQEKSFKEENLKRPSTHEPLSSQISFQDVQITPDVLESNNIFVSDNKKVEDNFFFQFEKKSPPKEEKKEANLDFLEDMFTGLIGNSVSKDMSQSKQENKKEEQKEVKAEPGWGEDDDIMIDEDIQLQDDEVFEEDKVEISSDKQGFGIANQEEDKQIQEESESLPGLQKVLTFANLEEEEAEFGNEDKKEGITIVQEYYSSPQQLHEVREEVMESSPYAHQFHEQNQNDMEEQKQTYSPKFETKRDSEQKVIEQGWEENDLDIDIDDVQEDLVEKEEKIEEQQEVIQDEKLEKMDIQNYLLEEVEQQQEIDTNQLPQKEEQTREAGWNDEDLDLDELIEDTNQVEETQQINEPEQDEKQQMQDIKAEEQEDQRQQQPLRQDEQVKMEEKKESGWNEDDDLDLDDLITDDVQQEENQEQPQPTTIQTEKPQIHELPVEEQKVETQVEQEDPSKKMSGWDDDDLPDID